MKRVEFFVAGTPKGQPRPRAFVRGGKARVYDPGTAEGWKGAVALAAREHLLAAAPIDTATAVWLHFVLPRPRTHFGKHGLKPSSPRFHVSKPDADNLAKAVVDTLVAIGFLRDDAFVWSLRVSKRYADAAPGCLVRLAW